MCREEKDYIKKWAQETTDTPKRSIPTTTSGRGKRKRSLDKSWGEAHRKATMSRRWVEHPLSKKAEMELTSILIRTMVSQTPILDPEGSYLQTYKTGVKANSIFPASFLREMVITGAHEEMHIMATACGSPNAPTRNAIRIGCQTVLQSIEGFYKTESTNRKFSLYFYRQEDAVLNQAGERKTLLEQYHDQMGRVELLLQSPSQAATPSSQESVGSTQGSAGGEGTSGGGKNAGGTTYQQSLGNHNY